jgi:hypothetical protein
MRRLLRAAFEVNPAANMLEHYCTPDRQQRSADYTPRRGRILGELSSARYSIVGGPWRAAAPSQGQPVGRKMIVRWVSRLTNSRDAGRPLRLHTEPGQSGRAVTLVGSPTDERLARPSEGPSAGFRAFPAPVRSVI